MRHHTRKVAKVGVRRSVARLADRALAEYGRAAAGLLAVHRGGRPMAWLFHSSAATAALAMAPAADATIVYSGIQNITVTATASGPATFSPPIDLDGAFGAEVRLGAAFSFFVGAGYLSALSPDQAVLATGSLVRNLASGNTVGPLASPFVPGPSAFFLRRSTTGGSTIGNFPLSAPGFAGLRFDRGGATHFAWLRLHVDATGAGPGLVNQVTLIDWAFEDQADTAIAAGAQGVQVVTNPPTLTLVGLGLLAAGARGIQELRRRRQAGPETAPPLVRA